MISLNYKSKPIFSSPRFNDPFDYKIVKIFESEGMRDLIS